MEEEEEQCLSSGDVMVLKEEEVEEEDSQEAQVTMHLHPVPPHGLNDNVITTIQAIQARSGPCGSTHAEDVEYGYPITCGDSRAVLLFKKFVCPGINVRCVMFHQQLISPKQFVQLSGKASLKDWKRAIRMGGVMLRKMMHGGQIDFYRHGALCTSTCRSTRFDVGVSPPGPAGPPHSTADPRGLGGGGGGGGQPGPGQGGDAVNGPRPAEEQKFTVTSGLRSRSPRPAMWTPPHRPIRRKRPRSPGGVWGLWRSVAASGLLRGVLSSIQTQLEAALTGLDLCVTAARLQASDAAVLHALCEALGLLDAVESALEQRLAETHHRRLHRRHGDHPGQRGLNTGDHLTHHPEVEFASDRETVDQRGCSEDAVANGNQSPRRTPSQPRPPGRAQTPPPAAPAVPAQRIATSPRLPRMAPCLPRGRGHTAGGKSAKTRRRF